MHSRWAMALLVVATLALAWLLWGDGGAAPPPEAARDESVEDPAASAEEGAPNSAAERTAAPPVARDDAAPKDTDMGSLHVRVTWKVDGASAVDVPVFVRRAASGSHLLSTRTNDAGIVVSGWARTELQPLTTTDKNGRFDLRGIGAGASSGARARHHAPSLLHELTQRDGACGLYARMAER